MMILEGPSNPGVKAFCVLGRELVESREGMVGMQVGGETSIEDELSRGIGRASFRGDTVEAS